jgi:hypothetical protein
MESQRKIITEKDILAVSCPACLRFVGMTCVTPLNRRALAFEVGVTECSFHAARIMKAQDQQIKNLGLQPLGSTEKALILYYAFIALCDSVSTKSQELFGKEFTSEDIQRRFAQEAIKELRHDGLFKDAKAN